MRELRVEIARIAVTMAQKVVRQTADAALHERRLNEIVAELDKSEPVKRSS
jgi:F0F1-type ATP synthase membrane subunit b/b'